MSNYTQYTDSVINAIDIIVNKAVSEANFDRTITGTVIACEDEAQGLYRVQYQDAVYKVAAVNPSIVYIPGTQVYILVPGNNFGTDKKIIGSVKSSTGIVQDATRSGDRYSTIGKSCSYLLTNLLEYSSGKMGALYHEVLYDKTSPYTQPLQIDNDSLATYIKNENATHLQVEASFQTNLSDKQRKGNYGFIIYIENYFPDKKNTYINKLQFSSDQMEGTPYRYTNFTNRKVSFEIDKNYFIGVNKVIFYGSDFEADKSEVVDIRVKDINISISEVNNGYSNPYLLLFKTPNGTIFKKDIDSLKIDSDFYVNNVLITNKEKLKYAWFVENNSITSSHKDFSTLGGVGWEDLKITESSIDFLKSQVLTERIKIKCVCTYEENHGEQELEIINQDNSYKLDIVSTNGEQLDDTKKITNLECQITPPQGVNETYKYYWVMGDETDYNTFSAITENVYKDSDIKDMSNKTKAAMTQRLLARIDEKIVDKFSSINVDLLTTEEDKKEDVSKLITYYGGSTYQSLKNNIIFHIENIGTPYMEGNKIYNLSAQNSSITKKKTYKCSVVKVDGDKEVLIGTDIIVLENTSTGKTETLKKLVLVNDSQHFKYNSSGVSPTSPTAANKTTIKPLKFTLRDKEGNALTDEQLKTECSILWSFAADEKGTMLRPKLKEGETITPVNGRYEIKNTLELDFNIADKYDNQASNNQITLIVIYQGSEYSASTNLSFNKEGAAGTNGTEYTCLIMPNIDNATSFKEYPTYSFGVDGAILDSCWNFTPKSDEPFKVVLYNNSEEVKKDKTYWKMLSHSGESNFKIKELNTTDNTRSTYYGETELNFETQMYKTVGSDKVLISNPENLLQATVQKNGKTYFSTLPIVTVKYQTEGYTVRMKPGSGYTDVVYSSGGINPQYNNNSPFEVQVLQGEAELSSFSCIWKNNEFFSSPDDSSATYSHKRTFIPIGNYNGLAVHTALECDVKVEDVHIATLHFPIHFRLNIYESNSTNKWNGNSIDINDKEGVILAPQVIAGAKDSDNSFTGIFIGEVHKDDSSQIGLFGYKSGAPTVKIDAETGNTSFGPKEEVRFTFDVATNEEGEEEVQGTFEMGPWTLTEDCFYRESSSLGGSAEGYLADKSSEAKDFRLGLIDKNDIRLEGYEAAKRQSYGQMYFGREGLSLGPNFLFMAGSEEEDKQSELYIQGQIYTKEGTIGPWYIDEDSLSFGENDIFGDKDTAIYLGKDGISVRDKFKIQINKDNILTSLGTCEIEEITSQLKGKISLGGKVDMEDYQSTLNDKLEFHLNGILSDSAGGEGAEDTENDADENSTTTTPGEGESESDDANTAKRGLLYSSVIDSKEITLKKYRPSLGLVTCFSVDNSGDETIIQMRSANGTLYDIKVTNAGALNVAKHTEAAGA